MQVHGEQAHHSMYLSQSLTDSPTTQSSHHMLRMPMPQQPLHGRTALGEGEDFTKALRNVRDDGDSDSNVQALSSISISSVAATTTIEIPGLGASENQLRHVSLPSSKLCSQ